MSYATTIAAAASSAQGVLAELQGAAVGLPNALYNGQDLIGIFGAAQTFDIPTAAGGYRRRAQLRFSATRDQFTTVPTPKKILCRTDIPSGIIAYLIDDIDANDPLFFHFTLVKNGD